MRPGWFRRPGDSLKGPHAPHVQPGWRATEVDDYFNDSQGLALGQSLGPSGEIRSSYDDKSVEFEVYELRKKNIRRFSFVV